MDTTKKLTRRSTMKGIGLTGSAAFLAGVTGRPTQAQASERDIFSIIQDKVNETPIVDTHEHLIEEQARLSGKHGRIRANDWSHLLSHYIDSDLLTAGMPQSELNRFLGTDVNPIKKWDILEPYWWRVKNTGYGQAVEIAMRELYDVEELSGKTIKKVVDGYHKTIRPGFYREVLQTRGGIESCQVNYLGEPFKETDDPLLLMQDISIIGMHMGPNIGAYAGKAGIEVNDLQDWHNVIDWWFDKYGPYAVAVKTQAAYSRNIDFKDVPADEAEAPFKKRMKGESLTDEEQKKIEDHLFWYAVRKATEYNLPVKMHTGYYAGQNGMPISRVEKNPSAVADLCRQSPETQFVFMHICYPYYEALISAAKHYTNCHIDMCWSWIISPVASVNFLKQYLVTAPANKVLTFGGDYIPVEPVLGHVRIARQGIAVAVAQLVQEGWLTLENALQLVDPIMRGNANSIFNITEKANKLRKPFWL